ncbi:MAG: hypothetical protein WD875_05470 [Pirellulales bacterium]
MQLHLTDELREALRQNPGQPLQIHDEQSQKDYLLIEAEAATHLMGDWLRQAIDEGVRAVEEGRVFDWNPEDTIRRGRERLAQRERK